MSIFETVKALIVTSKPPAPLPPDPLPPKKRILIVEDDTAIRQLYTEILSAENYEVSQAENGQAGLDSIIKNKPDLVLLDLMMPIMDGKTLLHKIREMPDLADMPVIVLSNAGDVDSMHERTITGISAKSGISLI